MAAAGNHNLEKKRWKSWGLKNTFIASVGFSLFNLYRKFEFQGEGIYGFLSNSALLMLVAGLGFLFAYIPATLGSLALGTLIKRLVKKGQGSLGKSIVFGFFVGMSSGAAVTVPIFLLLSIPIGHGPQGTPPPRIAEAISALILAAVAGGLTARQIYLHSTN